MLYGLLFRSAISLYAHLTKRGWVVAIYRSGGAQFAPLRTIALCPVGNRDEARDLEKDWHRRIVQGVCDEALPLGWREKRQRLAGD